MVEFFLIDSHFYVITCQSPDKLFIFNQEGELIDEVSVESIGEYIQNDGDGFIFLTKYYIFVTSSSGEKV